MFYRWKDDYLAWNPEDYNDIKIINTEASKLWIPDTVLYDELS